MRTPIRSPPTSGRTSGSLGGRGVGTRRGKERKRREKENCQVRGEQRLWRRRYTTFPLSESTRRGPGGFQGAKFTVVETAAATNCGENYTHAAGAAAIPGNLSFSPHYWRNLSHFGPAIFRRRCHSIAGIIPGSGHFHGYHRFREQSNRESTFDRLPFPCGQ